MWTFVWIGIVGFVLAGRPTPSVEPAVTSSLPGLPGTLEVATDVIKCAQTVVGLSRHGYKCCN